MSRLIQWVLEQRARRVVFLLALFPLPFLQVLSAALLVTTALIRGHRDATVDMVLALAALSLMSPFIGLPMWQVAAAGAGVWVLPLLLGALARVSLGLALQAGALLAVAAIALVTLVVPDPTALWVAWLEQMLAELGESGAQTDALAELGGIMTGLVITSVLISGLFSLFLGMAWAGPLPAGTLGEQFRGFRLGTTVGAVAAVLGVLALLNWWAAASQMLLVIGLVFALQGLAVVHWWAHQRKWPGAWWLALYVPLLLVGPVLLVQAMLLLAAMGFVDNWYSLRRQRQDMV